MDKSKIIHRIFSNGGFSLHKVTDPSFAGRASAWYDKDGRLLDAEIIDCQGHCRKVGKNAIPCLESAGRIYRKTL